jgi:hypothetical protein
VADRAHRGVEDDVTTPNLVIAFGVSVTVSVIFGVYPAMKSS